MESEVRSPKSEILLAATEEDTRQAAASLAAELGPDDVVALAGPLGAGKTVFIRAIAEARGADPREVASPTFAILHEYVDREGRLVLLHLDLYRLSDDERELLEIGVPGALEGRLVAVEWPNRAFRRLMPVSVEVSLTPRATGEREIRIDRVIERRAPDSMNR